MAGASRALIFLLGAAVFLNYVDRGAVGIAAPLMQGDLGLSATEFGLAMLAGSGSGDIRDLALGHLTQKKVATGMLGRLVAAMRGGF